MEAFSNNDAFVNDNVVRYSHEKDPSIWVEIKAELSGPEERQRDALAAQTQMRVANLDEDDIKEAREKAKRRGRFGAEEGEAAGNMTLEAMVSTIKAELDLFDLDHYVKAWSFSQPVGPRNIRKLKQAPYNWILTMIDQHRLETVLTEDDVKNSQSSSSSGSKETASSPKPATPGASEESQAS